MGGINGDGGDIRVLHVDDEPALADAVARAVQNHGENLSIATESDPSAALERLIAGEFECVVSDYEMPGMDGLELLEAVRAERPDLPFVLFTGRGSEEIASEAITAGVTDYIQKGGGTDTYRILANRIENAVGRYRAERDRERSERRFRALAETVPDAIVTVDPDGTVAFANPATEGVFGRTPDELEGEPFTVVFPPEDRERLRERFDDYLETGEQALDWTDAELSIQRPGGERVPVSLAVGEMEFDGHRRFVGIYRDIAERKERERRVRETERRYRRLVEQNVVGIFIVKDGEYEYVNPHFAETMGYTQAELTDGMSPFDLTAETDQHKLAENLRMREEGEVQDLEYTLRGVRKSGEEMIAEIYGTPIEIDGEPAIISAARDVTEREQVRRELEESERKFRSIAEASYDAIFRLDPNGTYTYLSPAAERITGYAPRELVGEQFRRVVVEADLPGVTAAFETVLDGEDVEDLEFDVHTKSGERRRLSINARPLYGDDEVVGVQGVARDVTETDRLAEEVRSTERRLERVIERVDDAFFALDDEWRFTHVNERAGELIDRDPADIVGNVVWDEFPKGLDSTFETEYRRAMENQEPVRFEERYPALDRWFEVRAYPDEDGLSVFFQDVTDRRHREQRLRESRDRVEALHDAAVGLASSETEAEVCRRTVDAATEVLRHELCSVGLREGDRLVTRAVSEGIADEKYYEGTPLDAGDALSVETYGLGESRLVADIQETAFATAGGQYRAAICVPLDDHGVFQAVSDRPDAFDEADLELAELLAAHAATALDRIRRESELRNRERDLQRQNERLEAFASVVSHDLRNPLSVARGNVEIARSTGDPAALDDLETALGRMEELIDDVLELARDPGPVEDLTPVSLADVAHEAWGGVSSTAGTLTVEDDRVFAADRGQLKRLFENLFTNSLEHGDTDGDVGVRVGTTDRGFFVADDGPGIGADDPTSVFEPGVSGDADGTGLGLAIVSRIADAHGWEVSFGESETGGAHFEVAGVEPR